MSDGKRGWKFLCAVVWDIIEYEGRVNRLFENWRHRNVSKRCSAAVVVTVGTEFLIDCSSWRPRNRRCRNEEVRSHPVTPLRVMAVRLLARRKKTSRSLIVIERKFGFSHVRLVFFFFYPLLSSVLTRCPYVTEIQRHFGPLFGRPHPIFSLRSGIRRHVSVQRYMSFFLPVFFSLFLSSNFPWL